MADSPRWRHTNKVRPETFKQPSYAFRLDDMSGNIDQALILEYYNTATKLFHFKLWHV